MNSTILILTDLYGDELRVNVDKIISYKQTSHYTTLSLPYLDQQVQCTAEELDKALSETYFMIKKVAAAKRND